MHGRHETRTVEGRAGASRESVMQGEFLPKMIWSCLRGRLFVAGLLALVLGSGLAVVGYRSMEPAYSSEARVRIAPSPTTIMFQTEFNKTTPYFRDFVMTEAQRLRSGPVHEMALADPVVAETGWPQGAWGLDLLERATEIGYPRGEVITASVTHEDRETARKMMNALLRAYMTLQDEQIRGKADTISATLTAREQTLRDEYEALDAQLNALVAQHGSPGGLEQRLTTLNNEAVDLRSARRELIAQIDTDQMQIRERRAAWDQWRGRMLGEGGADVGPTAELLALTDDRVADLIEQRRTYQKRIEMERAQGLLESHPSIIEAFEEIDLIDGLIENRVGGLVDQWWAEYAAETDTMVARVSSSRRQGAEIESHLTDIEAQLTAGSRTLQDIRAVETKTEGAQERLQAVVDRREEVGFEHTSADSTRRLGQAEVLQWASMPLYPSKDSRKVRAAAGFIAGGGMGVSAVVALGLLRRRYRYTDELVDADLGAPLIGSVPVLTRRDLSEPGRMGELAHQLRAVIELRSPEDARVLAVTSSTSGEGKSTVAVAIAASFAAAGRGTLLIDADPHGGAVTHRFGIAPAKPGFGEAVRGRAGEIETVASSVENLDVLPVGGAQAAHLPAVSRGSTGAMMRALRERYERVVVDTGVISGSAEAALCCQASDAVIAVVGRGQTRAEVHAALARMHELGLRCDGLIFNRAEARDAERYTSMPAWSAEGAGGARAGGSKVASAYS